MSETQNAAAPAASGDLDSVSFASFLFGLFKRDATGELRLSHAGGHDVLYVREGFPVSLVNDRVTVDVLSRIVVELGLVAAERVNHSLGELAQRPGVRHGEVMVQLGYLEPEGLQRALGVQLRRKLNRLFYLRQAHFEWWPGEHGVVAEIHSHPFQAILQGVRSAYDEARLAAVDARLRGRAVRLPGGFAPYEPLFEFDEEEQAAVRLLAQGFGRLEDLGRATRLGEQGTRALLHALDVCEVLDVRPLTAVSLADWTRPPQELVQPSPSTGPAARPARSTPQPGLSPVATPPPPPARSGPSTGPLADRVRAKFAQVENANHFEVLEVAPTATAAQIAEAYRSVAKVFHPDRLPPGADDLRALVDDIFRRVTEAHRVLADDAERQAYAALLQSGGPTDKTQAARILEAESAYRQGEAAAGRGQWALAAREFAEAVRLNPGEPDHAIADAVARWHVGHATDSGPRLRREALAVVTRATKERKPNERLEFWLAELLEAEGNEAAALAHYRKALELNPRNVDAKRKVHLHERRVAESKGPKEKPGLLGGLFGKKK